MTVNRLLRWLLAATTHPHWDGMCGRFSGYHDEGLPMLCRRRAGHFGPWHYDPINGLVWRSGEEPRALPDERLSTLQSLARSLDAQLIVDFAPASDLTADAALLPEPFDVEAWHRNRDAWREMVVLEQRFVCALDLEPDAMTFPGADGSSTYNGRPIIDGARPGLVFYIEGPPA